MNPGAASSIVWPPSSAVHVRPPIRGRASSSVLRNPAASSSRTADARESTSDYERVELGGAQRPLGASKLRVVPIVHAANLGPAVSSGSFLYDLLMTVSAGTGTGRRAPQELQRTRILRSAALCLARQGFEGVRLRDIARASGVSIGLLQHYFETRDQLLEEAFEQATSDFLDCLRRTATEELDPWLRIKAIVHQPVSNDQAVLNCKGWVEFCAGAAREARFQPVIRGVYLAWRQLLADTISQGIQQGLFRPLMPTEDVTDILLTHIDGCELAVATEAGLLDVDRFRFLVLETAATLLDYPSGRPS